MSRQMIIDGKLIEVDDSETLMHACERAGAEIPRFCYQERLSIAGNCRMCLVEVAGSPKPIASCAMSIKDLPPNRDGTPKQVFTNSALVKKAREGVLEFLLINHPLDCPICDQGGECDLQDQAMAFGLGGSRFAENKRAVEDKYIGPLIKTVMTRCIHCTRCVRFMTEIAGVEELGLIGRGEDAEITTYLEKGILSELSANVVDLCPVGALTHKPWAHNARPWELRKTESIDVMDALGSAIRVDSRGKEVMRILPRNNDAVNEEWISDKTRHIVDGLKTQRLDQPYVRKDGRLVPTDWPEAFQAVAAALKAADPNKSAAISGDVAGVEELYALKTMLGGLGITSLDCRQDGATYNPKYGRGSYLFNSTIEGIEDADAIVLIGTNPRLEAPVLNARIRKVWRTGAAQIAVIGEVADLTYEAEFLGSDAGAISALIDGTTSFAKALKEAKRPVVIVGDGLARRSDGALALAAKLADMLAGGKDPKWRVFNVLHSTASRVGALDVGFVPSGDGMDVPAMLKAGNVGQLDFVYLLGADDFEVEKLGAAFVVYQGSHGDRGAHRADVILPGAAYTEKSATYVNMEGRVQQTVQAIFPPGDAKEDWKIIRALSEHVGAVLPFATLEQLRAKLYQDYPVFAELDRTPITSPEDVAALAKAAAPVSAHPVTYAIDDFYMTNPIARASRTMAEMSALKQMANQQRSSSAA